MLGLKFFYTLSFQKCKVVIVTVRKGTVHPRMGCEGPEGVHSTHSLTLMLNGGGLLKPLCSRERDTRTHCTEAWWAPGLVWTITICVCACFIYARSINLVADIAGGKEAEGV